MITHLSARGQLALNVQLRDASSFENFHMLRNREAVSNVVIAVERSADSATHAGGQWKFEQIFLAGERGCGKTHLLEAAARLAQDLGLAPAYVPLRTKAALVPGFLEGLESAALVCLDDLDSVVGDAQWEQSLLRLYEGLRSRAGTLLVAASSAPAQLGLGLPDLATRLGAGLVYQLHPLNDDEKLEALRLRARNRGLDMGEEVARYVLSRYPRNTHALFSLLDRIDLVSLETQRRLTIPFIRSLLAAGTP